MKIGKIIKELRCKSNLTQAELAKRSGLDFTTISKLEKGSLTGTITTHRKIAKALGISLLEFYRNLEEPPKPFIEVTSVKRGQTGTFYFNEKVMSQILLKQLSGHKMAPELTRLEKGGVTDTEQKPKGTEQFIFVLEGSVEVKTGDAAHNLKKGGSIYFDAATPHTIKNLSATTSTCLRVSSPATL